MDYEITKKGKPERGSVNSQKSLATLMAGIFKKARKIFSPKTWSEETKFVTREWYPVGFMLLHFQIAILHHFEFLNFIPANNDYSVNGGVHC